jgi:hypothetical protein
MTRRMAHRIVDALFDDQYEGPFARGARESWHEWTTRKAAELNLPLSTVEDFALALEKSQ